MLKYLVLGLFSFSLFGVFSQTFRFNNYTTEDGIAQDFIYSISQDSKGYLWIGTGEGLSKFDGKNFVTYTTSDGLSENIITSNHVDAEGTQWFGHNEGGITKYSHGKFTQINVGKTKRSVVNCIISIGNDIYFTSQNSGVFQIKNDKVYPIGKFEGENFFGIEAIDSSNMIVATDDGLIHLKLENNKWIKYGNHFEGSWITSFAKTEDPNVLILATRDEGISKLRVSKKGGLEFSRWDGSYDFSEHQVNTLIQDSERNIWLGTKNDGLIKLHTDTLGNSGFETTRYNTSTGMSSDYIQTVFEDREGNIWAGTFGMGLSALIDDFFTFYKHEDMAYGNNVSAIWINEQTKWYGVENGLIRIDPTLENKWTFYNSSNGFVDDKVTSMYEFDSVLWIGTATSGLFEFDERTEKMSKVEWEYGNLQNNINQITCNETSVWIATEGGLIVYFKPNQSTTLFDTQYGLAHNSIKSICRSSDGRIWMGTRSRFIYALKGSMIEEYEISKNAEVQIVSITEDLGGDIWFATAEDGVYKKVGRTFVHFESSDGLKSDYCYSIHTDADGYMWVGHRAGLSKISPSTEQIIFFDHNSGIDHQVNLNAMFLDEKSYLWIGTEGGAIKYDPEKAKEVAVPPIINLLEIVIGDQVYSADQEIFLPYNNYRINFNFIGISFKNSDQVKYQFKLEGYDGIFSEPSDEPSATYGRIADGEYVFRVVACIDGKNCSETEATIKITIAAPFWKTWWFYTIMLVLVILGTYLFIQARIKRFKTAQIRLEQQLAIKTKEVVEKADRIEEINKDITASINYAKRIQTAILPLEDALEKHFPNSFIFFQPRDVVSGDFYYIKRYDNRLIVACCDCTGHGVPGAFMSMIGATTLRNIYRLMENSGNWRSPEKVLELLDLEIQKILHQGTFNAEVEEDYFRSRDGMDLTLCEIDLESNVVSISAAKRHSFIKQNNEVKIFAGDKRGIGGGEIDEIDFTLSKFTMHKGDVLYLFTDGYPDQFGGPDSRKLKISGTEKIIAALENLPPEEHAQFINSKFNDWKGDLDQIDDVLFMGILF